MKTKHAIIKGQVRTVDDAVEAWQTDHQEAMYVCDVEDIIGLCLPWPEMFETAYAHLWDGAFQQQVPNIEVFAGLMRNVADGALQSLGRLATAIDWAKRLGYTVGKEADFIAAKQRVEELTANFKREWPWITPQGVAEVGSGVSPQEDFGTLSEVIGVR